MKQRVSALDLQLLTRELKESLESYRLSNIYNVVDSTRQFILKFAKADSKINVCVDCGLRIHTTTFNRPVPQMPSTFIVKLRKHLKSKRLTAIRQVPNDRILVFQFADGLYHLVFEFFSAGNVILLDKDRKILALQRVVHEFENKVGEIYTMFDDSLFSAKTEDTAGKAYSGKDFTTEIIDSWLAELKSGTKDEGAGTGKGQEKQSKRKGRRSMTIHKLLLSKEPHLSSDLLQNNLRKFGIDPSVSPLEFCGNETELVKLLNDTETEYNNLLERREKVGYIVSKRNPAYSEETDSPDLEFVFENFHPFEPFIDPVEEREGTYRVRKIMGPYNETVDTFFSTIEQNKYTLRIQNQKLQARKKLESARLENAKRIQDLLDLQTSNEEKGNAIIFHSNMVDDAKTAVQTLLDQQMDWKTIEKIIESEQRKGNKTAQIISLPLDLKRHRINLKLPIHTEGPSEVENDDGTVTNKSSVLRGQTIRRSISSSSSSSSLSLSSSESDSDVSDFEEDMEDDSSQEGSHKSSAGNAEDGSGENYLLVSIDLGLSAYANASEYFTAKKTSAEKKKKIETKIGEAMKNIEAKIEAQLNENLNESHEILKKIRKPYFFEKYYWFLSNEGYLVLMGRSPMETDLIYARYIEDDDIFVSNGFGTVAWIKNPDKTVVSPDTLMQAGVLCLSATEAWQKRLSSAPWWCYAKNVSKFDSVGSDEALQPGYFRVKDESVVQHMRPVQLVMGLAFLWKLKTENPLQDEEEETQGLIEEEEDKEEGEEEEEEGENNEGTGEAMGVSEGKSVESAGIDHELVDEANDRNPAPEASADHEDATSEIERTETDENDKVQIATSIVANMDRKVRGKKGKLKKIQRKYADQDEDERLIRLKALGTLKMVEKERKKKQSEALKQEEKEYRKQKRAQRIERHALQFTSGEKVKVNYSAFKDELKATLDPTDEVVDVIPVFAPWQALLKYKYKVKVQPGNGKKLKSINDALHYFTNREVDNEGCNKELDWPKEHGLIETLKGQELIPLICVDKVSLSLPHTGGGGGKKGEGDNSQKKKKKVKGSGKSGKKKK